MYFLIPTTLGACFIAFLIWLHIEGARERKRRLLLPEYERLKLEGEDALWAQRFSF
jgi:hypothetical protein